MKKIPNIMNYNIIYNITGNSCIFTFNACLQKAKIVVNKGNSTSFCAFLWIEDFKKINSH